MLTAKQVVILVPGTVLVLAAYCAVAMAAYTDSIYFRVEETLHGE